MVEVSKPDYLSLVNKGGSGFNVSEIVTSLVAAEIAPKRAMHETKQEKSENAISGLGYLNSQATLTKSKFDQLASDKFYAVSSSNISGITAKITDEMKAVVGNRSITNVTTAKKMIFEFSGFTSLTATHSANLTIDFGTWTKTAPASSASTNAFASGKSYLVTSKIEGAEFDLIKNDTTVNYNSGGEIPSGTIITIKDGRSGTITNSFLKEVDYYAFSDADTSTQDTLSFTGKTLNQIAALFESKTGLTAKVVDVDGSGSNYSLIVSSELTGAKRGFKIEGDDRWLTPGITSNTNKFSQISEDSKFTLDGVSITRTTNTITNVIEGVEIELKSDFTSNAIINTSRSDTAVKKNVNDVIASLNEFKAEIDRLTYIDVEGDNNGPLAMDPSVTKLKSDFKKLAVTALLGYGNSPIYLSQLGIKTNDQGNFYLDETMFSKTYSSNPEYFLALKDDNLSTDNQAISVKKSQFTNIEEATYNITDPNSDGNYVITKSGSSSGSSLLKVAYNGGSRFTSTQFPGLQIESSSANPAAFKLYSGKSFSKKLSELMSAALAMNSSLNSAKESYKLTKLDITERLAKLDVREKLLTTQYTERFGAMEQAMSQFNSTKTLLDNFVESWKKQK